jgi:phosphatidylserine/phosphatidylglycerophosphate/cardiolipin synthase-like enzyme
VRRRSRGARRGLGLCGLLVAALALWLVACGSSGSGGPVPDDAGQPGDSAAPPADTGTPPRDGAVDGPRADGSLPTDGAPVHDATPPSELTKGDFSYVGQAVLTALETLPGERYRTWNYRGDAVLEPGWVLQTPPKEHWGQPASTLPMPAACSGAGCDADFGLKNCTVQADCTGGGVCRPVPATVTEPGGLLRSLCTGHSDALYDEIYQALVATQAYADVANLSPPDGRFLAAIRNALTFLARSGSTARVRFLFGDVISQSVDTAGLLASLTRDLPAGAQLQVHVGAYRKGLASWNHAKMVAIDDTLLIQGGHNFWTDHYLTTSPVHDLSLRVRGTAAIDAHLIANVLWDFTCTNPGGFSATSRASYPAGAPDCPTAYTWQPQTPFATAVRVIGAGRLGAVGDDPSDAALLAMVAAARTTVRLSQQDFGPPRVGGIDIGGWPKPMLGELGRALVRGVTVYAVLSNPYSIPGGLTGMEATYGNGWTAGDVAAAIELWFQENPAELPVGTVARDLICTRFNAALLRFSNEDVWPGGANIGNHAKLIVVDDLAFYLGAQNLYVSDLSEYGLFVDSQTSTAELLTEYWTPLWQRSRRVAESGAEAASCTW